MTERFVLHAGSDVKAQWWDDETRTYHEYTQAGVETLNRPYTALENAEADARATEIVETQNKILIEDALLQGLALLQAIIDDTNANINSNPATRIKDLARVQRRLIRLVIRRFEGAA